MSSSIYTRRGDDGSTSLAGGERVRKDSARVEAYGTVDEANSAIGSVRAALEVASEQDARIDRVLNFVQHRLMNCSSRLATLPEDRTGDTPHITAQDVTVLESAIDDFLEAAGPIDHFVLPAGCEVACRLHIARTIMRRAERRMTTLSASQAVDPEVLAFVNRASDLLFAAARYANAVFATGDVLWDPDYASEL